MDMIFDTTNLDGRTVKIIERCCKVGVYVSLES